jgi:hypothetical protein
MEEWRKNYVSRLILKTLQPNKTVLKNQLSELKMEKINLLIKQLNNSEGGSVPSIDCFQTERKSLRGFLTHHSNEKLNSNFNIKIS